MPLRNHYPFPLDDFSTWDGIIAMWPMVIVQRLNKYLPPDYVASPRAHRIRSHELKVDDVKYDEISSTIISHSESLTTAHWKPAAASLAVETTLPDFDEYEVRVYDTKRGRRLVASLEIVSPANKDRPEHRNAFAAKCAALLREEVAVSIVDLVSVRQSNLYAETLSFLGHRDKTLSDPPPHLYAASCRYVKKEKKTILEGWSNTLTLGQPLPTLPLWLSADLVIPLDLEPSYEQACHDLQIT